MGQSGDELDLQTCSKISYKSNRKWLKSIKFKFFCHFWPVNHLIAFCFCSNLIQWISPWVEHILQVSSSYIKGFLTNRVFSKFEIWHFPIKNGQKPKITVKTPKTKVIFSLFAISRHKIFFLIFSKFFSENFSIFRYLGKFREIWLKNYCYWPEGHKKLLLLALGP